LSSFQSTQLQTEWI